MPVNIKIENPPLIATSPALITLSKWLLKLKLWADYMQSLINTLPSDHGKFTGLADDDHPQYLRKVSDIPASSISAGTVNTYALDANYLYVCIATSQWVRFRAGNAIIQEPDTW